MYVRRFVCAVGNLPWALHNYYLQYAYTRNTSLLSSLYPLLRRAITYYMHLVEWNPNDQRYHLPITFSPEYPTKGPDTNYDLALFRWGLQTLLEIAKELQINDPAIPQWQSMQTQL